MRWTVLVAVGFGLGAPVAAAADPFVFRIPAGWTDLSARGPADNLKGVQDDLVQEALKAKYAAFAVGPAPAEGGLQSTFNAILLHQTTRVTPALLDEMMTSAATRLSAGGWSLAVREKQIVTVSGVGVGRVVSDLTTPAGLTVRQMQYVMPGLEHGAVLTYSASADEFDRLRPAFEASALATQGIREPTLWARLFHTDWGHSVLGGITGAALVALLMGAAMVLVVKWTGRVERAAEKK